VETGGHRIWRRQWRRGLCLANREEWRTIPSCGIVHTAAMNGIVVAIEWLSDDACRGDCAFPMALSCLARLRCQRLAATSSCPSLPQSTLTTLTHILPLLIHFAPSAVPLGYCDFPCALIVLRIRRRRQLPFAPDRPVSRVPIGDTHASACCLLLGRCPLTATSTTAATTTTTHSRHRVRSRRCCLASPVTSVVLCSPSSLVALTSVCRITSSSLSSVSAPRVRDIPIDHHPLPIFAQLAERALQFLA